MTTAQWTLSLVMLGWVLSRNLGTRPVTRATFLTPLLLVGAAAAFYLRTIPTAGGDLALEAVGTMVGVLLGALAASFTTVRRPLGGGVSISAGAAFAVVWLGAVGGRVAFAEWATHSGARTVGEFSMRQQITGAEAWTAAFVLMTLAMVLARTAVSWVGVRNAKAQVMSTVAVDTRSSQVSA